MNKLIEPKTTSLISLEELYQGVYLAWFDCERISKMVLPGQFVMLTCDEYPLRRPFAVHQVNEARDRFAILFSVVGKGTLWFSQQKAGTRFNVLGPLGNSFSFINDSQNILLVAGGLGIAPLYFVAQAARQAGKSVTLLQGASSVSCMYPISNLPEQVKCYTATEDGSRGEQCLVTDILHKYIGWADQIMACGPNPMYHPIAVSNKQLVPTKPFQISLEVRMGCGFGACYGCSIKTTSGMKKVCHDGPVFDYKDIIWDNNPGI